jgi:hypothetical protein
MKKLLKTTVAALFIGSSVVSLSMPVQAGTASPTYGKKSNNGGEVIAVAIVLLLIAQIFGLGGGSAGSAGSGNGSADSGGSANSAGSSGF